jgi:hypothetical protein
LTTSSRKRRTPKTRQTLLQERRSSQTLVRAESRREARKEASKSSRRARKTKARLKKP